jgi:hypothetical protein
MCNSQSFHRVEGKNRSCIPNDTRRPEHGDKFFLARTPGIGVVVSKLYITHSHHTRIPLDLQPIYHQRPSRDHRSCTEPRRRRIRRSFIIASRQLSRSWNKTGRKTHAKPTPSGAQTRAVSATTQRLNHRANSSFAHGDKLTTSRCKKKRGG